MNNELPKNWNTRLQRVATLQTMTLDELLDEMSELCRADGVWNRLGNQPTPEIDACKEEIKNRMKMPSIGEY